MREISPVSMRDILSILFKHQIKIVAVFLIAISTAVGYLMYTTPIYIAETKILVLLGREKFSAIDAYNKDSYNILFQERGQNINNEIEIITDKQLTYNVFDRLHEEVVINSEPPQGIWENIKYYSKKTAKGAKEILYTPLYWLGIKIRLDEREKMVLQLRGALGIEFIEDTDVIKLSVGWPDPNLAAHVTNAYAQEYVKRHIEVLAGSDSQGFYLDQISVHSDKLSQAEEELKAFLALYDISNLPLQKELLLRDISGLETRFSKTYIAYENARVKAELVEDTFNNSTDWIETPDIGDKLADLGRLDQQYFELLGQRNRLATTNAQTSRQVKNVDRELEQLRVQKRTSLMNFFKVNLAALDRQKTILETELADKNALLKSLGSRATRLGELKRTRHITEQNYFSYRKKAEELRISEGLNDQSISSVRILSPATPPPFPATPRKSLILGLAVFLGAFLGIGYAILAEFFSHTFRDRYDVANVLDTQLLATIPQAGAAENWQLWKDRILGNAQQPSGPSVPLVLPENAGESLQRTIAQLRKNKKRDQICIGICGCHHSVGTSTITLNMAQQAAASEQENVLVVEANRRSPVFADYYDLEAEAGITEWLAGGTKIEDVIHSPDSEKHRVITCTDKATDLPTANLESIVEVLRGVEVLRSNADITFIDLPPALLYAETAEIAAHVDGVILVIQAEQDKWEAAGAAKELLASAGATLLGVILNRKEYYIPDWLYRHL